MLQYKKEQLLDRYSDVTVKVNATLLAKFGYIIQKSFLVISGYRIFFTPLYFKLRECSILVSLRETETKFFSKYKDELCSIHLSFKSSADSEDHPFFVKGHIASIQQNTSREDTWIYTFSFKSESDYYIRNFLLMADLVNKYQTLYNSKNPAAFCTGLLANTIETDTLLISKEKTKIGLAHIQSISVQNIQIVINLEHHKLNIGDRLNLYTLGRSNKINLTGTVDNKDAWEKDKSLTKIFIKLDYNMHLIDRISSYLNTTDVEEIEDLQTNSE